MAAEIDGVIPVITFDDDVLFFKVLGRMVKRHVSDLLREAKYSVLKNTFARCER